MKNTRKSALKVGLQFFVFLRETDRASVVARAELKEIYNSEFKARNGDTKVPGFSTVLYVLKQSGQIHVAGQEIRVLARMTLVDQWQRPRRSQPQTVSNVEEDPAPDRPPRSAVEENKKAARDLTELLKNNRSLLISNKFNIVISSDCDFHDGKLLLDVETEQHVVHLNIENTGSESVLFTYYTALHKLSCFTLKDERKVTRKLPLSLNAGDRYAIHVEYRLESPGYYPVTLAFEFERSSSPSPFVIVRDVCVHYLKELGVQLKATAPFKRPRLAPQPHDESRFKVVEGVPPDALSRTGLRSETPLYSYMPPPDLVQRIRFLNKDPPADKSRALACSLTSKNYSQKFRELLYLEEHQMQVDIRQYFISNDDYACMRQDPSNKKLLILKVPGLSENRPSVLRGDRLLIYPKGETRHKYAGYVHSVQQDSVKLGFDSKFLENFAEGLKFNVEFTCNRLPLRLQHRAVQNATEFKLEKVLFPPDSLRSKQIANMPDLSFYDRQLEKNPEQSKAVRHIVYGTSKPAPYVVFGPPGTGKTVTLVEAVKQVDKIRKDCHILVCAPSNSATDLLCARILKGGHGNKGKVYRMYASSRDPKSVPPELKAHSNLDKYGYCFPSKEELMEYRILVTTLLTAGRLVTGNLPVGHFTHIFVDEAGQAKETECLIPLAGLLDPEAGQVVLAGDHKQLGPIVASPLALKYGLGVSLLERLMSNPSSSVYCKDGAFNDLFVTKLLRNFRSHPAILKVPNELFYDGELQACADEKKRNRFCEWEHLERADFPVIFHGVTGMDEREANSPSSFNRAEVEVVIDIIKKLLQMSDVVPKDIGIITPYRKQKEKFLQALRYLSRNDRRFQFMDMAALKVGTVEEFQGQEREVILVSTVRSDPKYTDFDKHFDLGFVANEKRFNVAMTRSQALLIVVGNPVVLATDKVWNHFIKHCQDSKVDRGYNRAEDVDAVAERLSALYLKIRAQVRNADREHNRTEE